MNKKSGSDCFKAPCVAIILGMHRSGTSALAGALSSLGYNLGDNLFAGDSYNKKGYFEDVDVVNISDSILESLGCNWHSLVVSGQMQDVEGRLYDEARDVISRHIDDATPWGFKDPRVTRLLPFWQDVFQQKQIEPRYLLSNRHPLSIADSLGKRDNLPLAHSLALWLVHQYDALQIMGANNVMVVDYDFMLSDTSGQLKRISDFLGINSDNSDDGGRGSKFLDVSLRHSKYAADDLAGCCGDLGDICKVLYEYLYGLAKINGSISLDDAHSGELLLSRIATYLDSQRCLFSAIDQGSKNMQHESMRKILVLEDQIKRLESQLTWLENNPIIKPLRSISTVIRRLFRIGHK